MKTKPTNEEYLKELEVLKKAMIRAEEFAEELPVFKDVIINRKLDSNFVGRISDKYKSLYLSWGINRYFYKDDKNITNYSGDANLYLFNIYINTLSLYDSHEKYGLQDLDIKCFFFDKTNTTFYIEEENIEEALEILNEWYLIARDLVSKQHKAEQKAKLEKALALLSWREKQRKHYEEIIQKIWGWNTCMNTEI